MADYIYTMELRLTPNQQKGVTLVQDIARAAGMNVYLPGGPVRDIISGFPIRDADVPVQRILHNYAFVEDPSRLIRASRFSARFHWPLEERTQARYDSAKENNYIEYISNRAIGYELEQLAYEDDPLNVVRILEKEGWLKVLSPHWTTAKVDTVGLSQLMKTRQQMNDLGYAPDPSPAVLHFLTARLNDKESSDIRKAIPRKDLAEAWRDLEDNAKDLAKR